MLDKNNKTPLISICIPTFNRCNKVYKLVNDLLLSPSQQIEVIVLDNCSTDETKETLNKIDDKRFSFVENEQNIGGELNILKVIGLALGKFSVLCLDKDYLDYQSIEELLKRINLDSEVVFGYCTLNLQKENKDIIYDKGYSSVMNMAYSSSHPTGMFYRSSAYINLSIVKRIFSERKKFAFYTDLINAEMAMIGKSQLINLPAFYTESEEEAISSPSFTYDVSNFYFSPAKRLVEFDTYLENALKLKLSSKELFKVINKLYRKELILSTFGYKKMMDNDAVCIHHRIAKRKVSFFEIWKVNLMFSSHFLHKKIAINRFQKTFIVWKGYVILLAKLFLSK